MRISLKRHDFPGKLIVFCGIDGSGKSTQLANAVKFFEERLDKEMIIVTKQPRDSVRNSEMFQKMMYSKNPNIDYRAVLHLTLSERIQHCHEEIIPGLKDGKIIISDRYIYTSIANMMARGYSQDRWFFDAIRNLPKPDLAILANAPIDMAISRIRNRPEEVGRFLDVDLLNRVHANFITISKPANLVTLDTSRPQEIVFPELQKMLEKLFKEYRGPSICRLAR